MIHSAWHLDWRLLPVLDPVGSARAYSGIYSVGLVATSVFIAILASFVALSISARVGAATTRRGRLAWTGAGAISMGGGIWAMHFIGMLAFSLPCGISYNPFGTMLSMLPGIIGSGVALNIVSRRRTPTFATTAIAAVLMGGGIGAMHYSGMAAVQANALLRYDPVLVGVSVGVAVVLAFLSLSIRFWLSGSRESKLLPTLVAASVMGFAISGMHYTAMQASMFFPLDNALVQSGMVFPPTLLAMLITLFVGLIAACTMVASFAGQQTELAQSLKDEIARGDKARKEAEAANAAKSQFLATMSHEIRTPINGILGIANLLASTPLNERQERLVENLSRSGQALLGVVNDILDFSKIEAGRFELFEVEFDLREMIGDVVDLFSERCTSAGLEFVYYVGEDVPSLLRGDPVRLRQVLVNLIGNAIKFTERGEIYLKVVPETSTADHVVLACSVEDTGIGIAAADHDKVFESFQQLDASMTRLRGGSGLGLAITKQLVELMGGRIWFESEPGRGSRFHFTARLGLLASSEGRARATKFPRSFRVLVVDGNPASARVMARYFASWNISAEIVTTTAEGLARWNEAAGSDTDFSVVIIDLKGLGKAGFGLAKEIRTTRNGRSGNLILLVGMDASIADESIDELGALATLSKPARPSELHDCLTQLAARTEEATGLAAFSRRKQGRDKRLYFDGRVLVAEDNLVNRDVVSGILDSMGLQVATAANGRLAVDMFMQDNFDVVLMDCEMPVIDGLEATKRIRAFETRTGQCANGKTRTRTPIIALTAHALIEVREKCLRVGMDDFLTKPFNEMQLGEALRRWLTPVERAPQQTPQPPESEALPPPTAVLDTSVFSEIRAFQGANGAARLRQIFIRFVGEAPALVKTIHTMHAEGNCDSVVRAAHSLKSSSAALGALQLSARCATVERLAREKGLDSVRQHLQPLDAELASAIEAAQAFMETADVAA
ncbi:MAG TPA: MHYT domain-containing protein [Rhizomicrobium sp.]|nr:MHYT domain-containing protein [Rhizomicrobium sp.]